MRKRAFLVIPLALTLLLLGTIWQPGQAAANRELLGLKLMAALPGLWHGPVKTDTPAGSFPVWYVDLRPVAPGQLSWYSTLDAHTRNDLSFFYVRYGGKLRLAQRTYGVFKGKGCITYEVLVKADPVRGYYKFADFIKGARRAYTEYLVKGDRLTMRVYTTKFDKQPKPTLHAEWNAVRGDASVARLAIRELRFPRPVMVKDFTHAFKNKDESIYFTFKHDPYPARPQPYVGRAQVTISIDPKLPVKPKHELFLLLTVRPLFEGIRFVPANMKYVSRCVFLKPDQRSYTFEDLHPGRYYIYSYNDINGDRKHRSGDYMSSNVKNSFRVRRRGLAKVSTKIDFVIP